MAANVNEKERFVEYLKKLALAVSKNDLTQALLDDNSWFDLTSYEYSENASFCWLLRENERNFFLEILQSKNLLDSNLVLNNISSPRNFSIYGRNAPFKIRPFNNCENGKFKDILRLDFQSKPYIDDRLILDSVGGVVTTKKFSKKPILAYKDKFKAQMSLRNPYVFLILFSLKVTSFLIAFTTFLIITAETTEAKVGTALAMGLAILGFWAVVFMFSKSHCKNVYNGYSTNYDLMVKATNAKNSPNELEEFINRRYVGHLAVSEEEIFAILEQAGINCGEPEIQYQSQRIQEIDDQSEIRLAVENPAIATSSNYIEMAKLC